MWVGLSLSLPLSLPTCLSLSLSLSLSLFLSLSLCLGGSFAVFVHPTPSLYGPVTEPVSISAQRQAVTSTLRAAVQVSTSGTKSRPLPHRLPRGTCALLPLCLCPVGGGCAAQGTGAAEQRKAS